MLFMFCVCHTFASVHCRIVVTCWERADLLALVCDVLFCFVTLPCSILGQVWYLIVSIHDLSRLSYFNSKLFRWLQYNLNTGTFPFLKLISAMSFTYRKGVSSLQIESWHEISNNVVCATSKDSDQPVHTHSLIRALLVA